MEWNTELIIEFINLYEKHPVFRDNIHHLLVRLLRFLFSSNNLAQDNTTTAAAAIATSVSSILELLGKRLYQTILVQAFATPCSRYICRTNCRTYLTQTFCPTLEPTFVASCSAGIRRDLEKCRSSLQAVLSTLRALQFQKLFTNWNRPHRLILVGGIHTKYN